MASLKGSKTEENLKAAFAGESQANRRYLYFAQKADVEGYNDVATVFRSTAEGETGHAHGHLEYLEETGTKQIQVAVPLFQPQNSNVPTHAPPTHAPPTHAPTTSESTQTISDSVAGGDVVGGDKVVNDPDTIAKIAIEAYRRGISESKED